MNSESLNEAEELQLLLIARATGKSISEKDARFGGTDADSVRYATLRKKLLDDREVLSLAPNFIKTCRSLDNFWEFIKNKFSTYAERKAFLRSEFIPLLLKLEGISGQDQAPESGSPAMQALEVELTELGYPFITRLWHKALERLAADDDTDGAVTAARSLVETVCKHILAEKGITANHNDPMPKLFKKTCDLLQIDQTQGVNDLLKVLAEGFANLRNFLGDSHGALPGSSTASKVLTEFVINLAASFSVLLIKSHKQPTL